jgi:predicted AAA+ superfamily ATPase
MPTIEDFRYVLELWKNLKIPPTIRREINIDINTDKIITIAGVRRSGKTSLMFQCIEQLLHSGTKKSNIIYVNFENERLMATKATDLDNLLIAHGIAFTPEEGLVYLFLDEIQNVENWDKWIRKIYDTHKYRIVITGSSSELLSIEIATALAGRNLSYTVYPFSFREFAKAKGIDEAEGSFKYSTNKALVLKALNEFLEYGSFPEVALANDANRKMELLSSYFDAIFFRDIVKRYKLRETGDLGVFLKILASNYSSYFSSTKTYNYFCSVGLKVSRKTILNFLEYAKSVFFTATLEQYHKSPKKRFARQQKSYIIDLGLSRLFGEIDKGRALENAVFIELLRRRRVAQAIYYVKLKSGKEVDFMVNEKNPMLLQVSFDVSSPETRTREISALVEAAKTMKQSECTIITYDYENDEIVDGIRMMFVPFWTWAL